MAKNENKSKMTSKLKKKLFSKGGGKSSTMMEREGQDKRET